LNDIKSGGAVTSSTALAIAVRHAIKDLVPVALSGVMVTVVSLGVSTAYAADSASKTGDLDEVVVSGFRKSVQTAQEIKQNAEVIVDSISAVDIGALPDRSVTEAIQRIPGVTIDHLFAPSDTNRFSAEGSGVAIRGMTQVRSELNGGDVFSARNTRGLSFEDVPSELMAGVDVYKNPSADMIEGGLGGTVNLRTRKPFDSKGLTGGVTASVNYGDFSKKAKPQASFLISDRWDTDIGEFGALLDVAYSGLATRTDSIQFGRPFRRKAADVGATGQGVQGCVDMTGGPAFECVFTPAGARWSELDFDRKRQGFDVALQWKPNDRTEFTLQAMSSDYKMDWTEHSAWFQDTVYNLKLDPNSPSSFDSTGLMNLGTYTDNGTDYSWTNPDKWTATIGKNQVPTGATTRTAEQHQKTTDYTLGFTFDATDRLSFSGEVQYVDAKSNNYDYTINTETYAPGLTIDLRGSLPRVSASSSWLSDPSKFYWAAGMDDTQANIGSETAARLDIAYSLDTGWFKSLKGGVRFTKRDAENSDTGYNWNPLSEIWQWWPSPGPNDWHPGYLATLDQYLPGQSTYFNFSNFYRGGTGMPGGIWVANESLVKNLENSAALLKQTEINGSGWPGTVHSVPGQFIPGDTNVQSEKTYAGYFLLRFGGDVGKLPLDGNVGMRVVGTYYTASGYAKQPDWSSSGLLSTKDKALGTGQTLPNVYDGNYVDALPSLNLRLKFTPQLQARFAVSKAISRPTFDQLRANITLGGDLIHIQAACVDGLIDPKTNAQCAPLGQPVEIATQVGTYKGDGGNPTLKPMRTTQMDAALEWYFAPQGSLYTTLFYKDIDNYFLRGVATENIFGQDWHVTSTLNGDHGVIKGFEVGYSQFYDFLPGWLQGFGAQANFTYVDSHGGSPTAGASGDSATLVPGLPLEGLSKTSYNIVAMYQHSIVEARLAYNWRKRWLLTTTDGDGKGTVWNDDYGQLDGSLFFHLNSHLQVGIEANNLTNTTQKLLIGPYKYTAGVDNAADYNIGYTDSRLYQNAWYTFDRRYALSVKYTF